MAWSIMQVGIEHLVTGLYFYGIKSENGIQFSMHSPSVFDVWSDEPFKAYWPIKGTCTESTPTDECPNLMRCSSVVADFAAQKLARAMNTAWELKDTEGNVLPEPIVKALIHKFGAMDIPPITRGYPYYWFTFAGMFHGIEPDGYIHT